MVGETNKRKYPRASIRWPVTLKTATADNIKAHSGNLSAGGAYIHCDQALNPGELLDLTIEPPHRPSLQIIAEVIWTRGASPVGMGVRFLEISENDCHFLNNIVLDHLRKEPKE